MQRCRICGNEVAKYGDFRYFSLWKCDTCGFVAKTYGKELQERVSGGTVYESGDWILSRQIDESAKRYATDLFNIYRSCLKPGSLLEIGPGDGWNLRLVRDAGWSVTGVEASRANCEYIKSVHGIDVINDRFENVRIGLQYDNVLLSHVIEHIEDPKPFLQRALDLLVPGGALVVATPNLCSKWSQLWGPRWSPYLVPDHISFFCTKHLELLAGERASALFEGSYEGPTNFSDSLTGALFNGRFQERMMQRLRADSAQGNALKDGGKLLRLAKNLSGRPFRRLGKTLSGTDLILVLRRR